MSKSSTSRLLVLSTFAFLAIGCDPVDKAFRAIDTNDTTTIRDMASEESFHALTDSAGTTPLMFAAALDRDRIVEILLEAKVPLEATAHNGITALGMAIGKGNLDITKRLLAAGANARIRFGEGEAVRLHYLAMCVHRKQFPACDLLLESGLEVDFRDSGSSTALHLAAFEGNTEGLAYLLGKGARCGLKDPDSNAVVHLLLRGKLKERGPALDLLARQCPDWNLEIGDQAGNTPLIVAASEGDLASIRTLVKMGADINARDDADYETALFTSQADAVKLLLELGADPSFKNAAGSTPVLTAMRLGWEESFHVLHDHLAAQGPVTTGTFKDPLAFEALDDDRVSYLTYMLDHGTDPSATDFFGNTLLDKAIEDDESEIIALLCSRGAKASAENVDKARAAGCKIP